MTNSRTLKLIFILSTLFLFSNALIPHILWDHFKTAFSKTYSTESEDQSRFQVFQRNLELIAQIQQADPTAEYGITQFSDLTPEEFQSLYLGYKPVPMTPLSAENHIINNSTDPVPDSWDWRDKGAVTQPKDQGICGACWAFSAIAAIESQYYLKHNTLYNLSEQQLIDCNTAGNGCYGNGSMIEAYEWLASNGSGLEPSEDYPYFGFAMPCAMNASYEVAKVTGYVNISQNESDIAQNLYTSGPLSTAVNGDWLQFYKKGVVSPVICAKNKLNHAVALVGFGSEEDKGKEVDYWIAKNSWGSGWGEEGFFRIKRGVGMCGINLNVSIPIIG